MGDFFAQYQIHVLNRGLGGPLLAGIKGQRTLVVNYSRWPQGPRVPLRCLSRKQKKHSEPHYSPYVHIYSQVGPAFSCRSSEPGSLRGHRRTVTVRSGRQAAVAGGAAQRLQGAPGVAATAVLRVDGNVLQRDARHAASRRRGDPPPDAREAEMRVALEDHLSGQAVCQRVEQRSEVR